MSRCRQSGFLQAALIVLAGWFVFSPAFQAGWLWDDALEITENPELRAPSGLWKIWAEPMGSDYYPLKTTVQWLQWRLWQNQPLGYHVSNIALHLLSALLLWHLFRKLGLRLAWLGGLLFVVHPVVVESVAWVAELKNTLSLPLLLLALCAWLDYDGRKQSADYFRALLFFLAAMLCKSSVVMFPVVLLLYSWWKHGRIIRTDWKATAAFFAVSLGLGLVTVWFQIHRAIGSEVIPMGGWGTRLAGAGLAAGFYFAKCMVPAGLLFNYPRWNVNSSTFLAFLPWLVLGVVISLLWFKRAAWGRHVLLGTGFFLVNLAPVLGFIPMYYLRFSWVADHFAYLPLVGLVGLAAAGAGAVDARLAAPLRPYVFWGVVLVLGLFAFQSHRYAGIFRDEKDLWAYVLQRNPESWLAHNNLGYVLWQAGRAPEAVRHYEEALRLRPDYARAYYNLGVASVQAGRIPDAIGHFEQAVRIQPDYPEAHYNLGVVLAQTGRMVEAIRHYQAVLQSQPDFAKAHNNLGIVLVQTGRLLEGMAHFEQALRIKPNFAAARANLELTRQRVERQQQGQVSK